MLRASRFSRQRRSLRQSRSRTNHVSKADTTYTPKRSFVRRRPRVRTVANPRSLNERRVTLQPSQTTQIYQYTPRRFETTNAQATEAGEDAGFKVSSLLFTHNQHIYHNLSIAVAAGLPLALAFPNNSLVTGVLDLGLSVVIPLHGGQGFNVVIKDYVPRPLQSTAIKLNALLIVLIILGLLKLSITDGITRPIAELFRPKKAGLVAPDKLNKQKWQTEEQKLKQ